MNRPVRIDPSWHPLTRGHAPEWASEWGEDRYGVFTAFSVGEVTQRLRWVPAGRFQMGSVAGKLEGSTRLENERQKFTREQPQHDVYISRGFWLFDTPCTQLLWQAVMADNPSGFSSPDRPVEQVSWDDVQEFFSRIEEQIPGLGLCLPTEAQWEYACRAGTKTTLYTGSIEIRGKYDAPALDPIAWYGGNSGEGFELQAGQDSSGWSAMQYQNPKSGTRPVGLRAPNAWGLYDMLGNVWEWCADGMRDYDEHWRKDPVGPLDAGWDRVIRGGAWNSDAQHCRCAYRSKRRLGSRYNYLGFRCARVQE